MTNRVKLKKSRLDYFRRLSRESKYEIQAYLIGEVVSPNLTVIDSFEYTDEYAIQTGESVAWYRVDYDEVRTKAEERGRRIVGHIHSHPTWDAVLSPSDYESCIAEGHRICGIVSTDGPKTRVRFWLMDCALPAEIVYATSKRAQARPEGTR